MSSRILVIRRFILVFAVGLALACLFSSASAATTSLHIVKTGPDGRTVANETTVTFTWMEANLPVYGDGVTRYYHQGPVFVDDSDPAKEDALRWNPGEDTNVQEKEMGAVKGTSLQDLCDMVGGMSPGEVVRIRAEDGFFRDFAYRNVYLPTERQGPIVLTWWKSGEGYVPDYYEGLRVVFFADNSINPWGVHAFGNQDWHDSAEERFWYYYRQGDERYPTTTGLSVKYVSELKILPDPEVPPAAPEPTRMALDPIGSLVAVLIVVASVTLGAWGRS